MESQMGKMEETPRRRHKKSSVWMQILLRTMAFAAALAATVVMATSAESEIVFGFKMDAKYSYTPAFRYFVAGNAIVAGYSLISMPLVVMINHQRSNYSSSYLMFLLDLVMMGLEIGAFSAASAVGYVGRYGNSHTGWAAICHDFPKFCRKSVVAFVCSFSAIGPFFILTATYAKPTSAS